ncbi:MAG: efflux RND transporter permease subunit, partial [Myxococcales bacterium]|nr:efflux RND transporter permease subunit [Myxococcales bacterium]
MCSTRRAASAGRACPGCRSAAAVSRFSIAHPAHVTGALLATFLCSAVILGTRGTAFLPPFNEGSAQVNIMLPPGSSLETSDAFGRRLEALLTEIDGVAHVARRTGRAEGDE